MSRLIDADAFDKFLEDAEAEATRMRKHVFASAINVIRGNLRNFPSAKPELPKQFMSDDCISRSELYKKVCEAEKLARERVLDTPSDSPFPNKLNPAYTRYSAQLDERTQFKHMIAVARSVQPEIIRCKDCKHKPKLNEDGVPEFPTGKCPCQVDDFYTLWIPKDDWFCGNGERREE